ncbi:hypothetical protein AHAS_Ahas11G0191900 [Arachis hypogaea]
MFPAPVEGLAFVNSVYWVHFDEVFSDKSQLESLRAETKRKVHLKWQERVKEMGQAFHRASGRIRTSSEVIIPKPKKVVDPPPPQKVDVSKTAAQPQDTLNADKLL